MKTSVYNAVMLAGAIFAAGAVLSQAPLETEVVVTDFSGQAARFTSDFKEQKSACAHGGSYLSAEAGLPMSPEGRIRIPAPAGRYYVYAAWVRHPNSAEAVVFRVGGEEYEVNQILLANKLLPEAFDMTATSRNQHRTWGGGAEIKEFKGVCGSGLYRLNDAPLDLAEGDALEVLRSDDEPGSLTTLDYVVFSPHLYLDDMGSSVEAMQGKAEFYPEWDAKTCGDIGFGHVSLSSDRRDAIVWKAAAKGIYRLSARPKPSPDAARVIPFQIDVAGGGSLMCDMAGHGSPERPGKWQDLAVVACDGDLEISVWAPEHGKAQPDLLRLTPVAEADLSKPGEDRPVDAFVLQWAEASDARPWLKDVRVVGLPGEQAGVIEAFEAQRGLPNGGRARVPGRRLPALGLAEGFTLAVPHTAWRVELADNYGFTLTSELLRLQPFLWFENLGMFVAAKGDFASHKPEMDSRQEQVAAQLRELFRSTSERYYEWSGINPSQFANDNRAFEFAYETGRPLLPRSADGIKAMPEPDYDYFCAIMPDLRSRKTFLGWPDVAREFWVKSNGALGTYHYTGGGTGHPEPEDIGIRFGAGETPVFRPERDETVTQSLEDGHRPIVRTDWSEADAKLKCAAFAYPAAGEDVKTGAEILNAFIQFRRVSGQAGPLWIEMRPEGPYGAAKNPLTGLADARIEGNYIMRGDRILLGFSGAGCEIAEKEDSRLLVKFIPGGGFVDLVFPYTPPAESLMRQALELGFEKAMDLTKAYWDRRMAQGAIVDVPDPIVADMYKTLYPRTMASSDLDADGLYVLKTAIHYYEGVWLHGVAYGAETMARRGHFEAARRWLDTVFAWQSPELREWAKNYTTNKGFFGGPPRYTPIQWVNFHGWCQWAAARYFLFSDDRAWLDAKLPALLDSMEWTAAQRRLTMKENADGSRPVNYGWLPAGRVTDGTSGTSTFSDCVNWMGFNELVRVLERVEHKRAAEFRAEADDYRTCILRGLRLAARDRVPVRINDGSYVPYVPGTLESAGHEEYLWYAGVVDGPLEGILDSCILDPADPMMEWITANLEDNLFVLAPNLADEAYALGHIFAYLRADRPELAIYTLYSVLASHMSRQTLTTIEHRSWGDGGCAYELVCWAMGYFTRVLAGMLCLDEGDDLFYCLATPKAWLEPGKTINVERLQTRYGPTSINIKAGQDRITGEIHLPRRYPFASARLRLRFGGEVKEMRINGKAAPMNKAGDTAALPVDAELISFEADITRR